MKIHGTAKGGALSKKDFGVAFSSGGAVEPIDDSELLVYWRFNESSGDVLNQSESDDSIGTGADLQITGASYDNGSPPVGKSMLFDGSNDYAKAGTSTSQFNFLNEGDCKWSVCFWMKWLTTSSNSPQMLFGNCNEGSDTGIAIRVTDSPDKAINVLFANSGAVNLISSQDYIPDLTAWHFYCLTYDQTLASSNMVYRRDNNNEETDNKSGTRASSNATAALNVGARPDLSSASFSNMQINEVSIWNRILTDDEQTELWNDGDGRAIY